MIEQYTSPVFANAGQEPWLVNRGVMVAGGVAIPSLYFDLLTGVLPGTVTFTRASTATYYDGVTTAKAEENLFYQSQDFTNATYWATNTASVSYTANTTVAPDGTTTADTMTASAGTGTRFGSGTGIYGITSGLVYTASLFVQAGTNTVVQLLFPTGQFGANAYANFDLSAGTVGSVGASATATISSAGGTWYRCSITATATASSTGSIGVGFAFTGNNSSAARLPSITAVGTETLILWGAQLEQRSSVTSYTATTTQPITNYIPVLLTAANNQPRFGHNPTTDESLGLLIEEQRTNLLTYSADFANAAWTKSGLSITSNTIVAPDGTLTGDKLFENTATSSHQIRQSSTVADNTTVTASAFLKAGERTTALLGIATKGGSFRVRLFDLANGTNSQPTEVGYTTVPAGYGIEPVGNGWYYCWVSDSVGTGAFTTEYFRTFIYNGAVSYTGNGYSGIYIWGAQIEAGAFPTSYIATTSAAATRSADVATVNTLTPWFNATEGTIYTESLATRQVAVGSTGLASFDDGTNSNMLRSFIRASGFGGFGVFVSSVSQADLTPGSVITANTVLKFANAYAVNNFASVSNASAAATDSSGTLPVVSLMRIGYDLNGVYLSGYLRRIAYYPRRLSDTELQVITS